MYEKKIRCGSGSAWYHQNARHSLSVTSQTLSSRVATSEQLLQAEKAHVNIRRKACASLKLWCVIDKTVCMSSGMHVFLLMKYAFATTDVDGHGVGHLLGRPKTRSA